MRCTIRHMPCGWVYIMSNRRNGTLYTGVTAEILRRAYEHRTGTGGVFTTRYGLIRLVWFERHEWIGDAIRRETNIKGWNRAWKVRLIHAENPEWVDLYPALLR